MIKKQIDPTEWALSSSQGIQLGRSIDNLNRRNLNLIF